MKCLYLTTRLRYPTGKGTMDHAVEPAVNALAITSNAASRPMNTTRPDQISRFPIAPASPVLMRAANLDGC
jgi:hypothetical protein